jgi:hypothetical protein
MLCTQCQSAQALFVCGICEHTVCPMCAGLEVAYVASGFIMGTSHQASVRRGVFSSHNFGRPGVASYRLSEPELQRLAALLDKYDGEFSSDPPKNQPRCADCGSAWFWFHGRSAAPTQVPELAQFFLELDPHLSSGPGGLF